MLSLGIYQDPGDLHMIESSVKTFSIENIDKVNRPKLSIIFQIVFISTTISSDSAFWHP